LGRQGCEWREEATKPGVGEHLAHATWGDESKAYPWVRREGNRRGGASLEGERRVVCGREGERRGVGSLKGERSVVCAARKGSGGGGGSHEQKGGGSLEGERRGGATLLGDGGDCVQSPMAGKQSCIK
jgi:hypothetical protein